MPFEPTPNDQTPDWLISDLAQVLDWCIQEGEYDEADRVSALLEQARGDSDEAGTP